MQDTFSLLATYIFQNIGVHHNGSTSIRFVAYDKIRQEVSTTNTHHEGKEGDFTCNQSNKLKKK